MAQQTLDLIIANQVTGMNEIAKLTNSVGALQKATADLNARTAELERMMGAGAKAIKGATNQLDAQSKALRNQRQGMQQAGMQINDFVTSVSTGASPVQAFNQQIGQLGYAFSLMGGRIGAVGRFLAGPWSIAVIGASMVLGPLVEGLFSAKEETDSFNKVLRETVSDADEAAAALRRLSAQRKTSVAEDVATVQRELTKKRDQLSQIEMRLERGIGGRFGRQALATRIRESGMRDEAQQLRWDILTLETAVKTGNDTIKKMGEASAAASGSVGKLRGSVGSLGASAREAMSPMQQFLDSINKTDERLELARQAFADGTISVRQFRQEVEKASKAQDNFAKIPDDMIKVLQSGAQGVTFPEIPQEIAVPPALQEILDKNREIAKSFDAIGNSVANGFKGMITGAQSFGDAMKGIIASVIDELFRLFVVQQIVGMVSKGMSMLTGIPIDARAMGGSVGQNKPYLVGERGPEIFVPGKSGTVIPTQNSRMGGGGGGSTINVSVDARGATSPEMVRQQVQQGILEAAPSIVAAAEQRTITTLRRPRLAGAL